MQFNSLADVKAHPWTGNGGAKGEPDYEAYEALNAYVQTDAPAAERAEAIDYAYSFYGCQKDPRAPEVMLREYIREWCTPDEDDD